MEIDDVIENADDSFDASVYPDLLPIYYKRLFPFSLYYKWLRYDNGSTYLQFLLIKNQLYNFF